MVKAGTQPATNIRYGWHDRSQIPLDHPAPFRFYLDHLLVPHSRREMVWATLARAFSGIGRVLLLASLDNGAVERSHCPSGIDEGRGGLLDVERLRADFLARRLEEYLRRAGVIVQGPLALLALDDYRHSGRRQTVLFVFDRESERPCAVAKVTSQATQQAVLEQEYTTLRVLQQRLDGELRATLPQPLALAHIGAMMVLLEGFLPGRPSIANYATAGVPIARHRSISAWRSSGSWDFIRPPGGAPSPWRRGW